MSIENEKRSFSLPGIPPDHPANVAIDGMHNLISVPPPDRGTPPTSGPAATAKAKADWEVAKEQAVQADPNTLNQSSRSARQQGLKAQSTATKSAAQEQVANTASASQETEAVSAVPAPDAITPVPQARKAKAAKSADRVREAVDSVQPAEAVAKPTRKTRAAAKAAEPEVDSPPAAEAAKPARTRRKAAPRTVVSQEPGPVTSTAPAVEVSDIPPITPEAISFLSDPDAKATDLFKLGPESQAFIRYHITHQQRVEADLELGRRHLEAIMPKFSPAFEKVADALIEKLNRDRRAGVPVRAGGKFTALEQANPGAERALSKQERHVDIQVADIKTPVSEQTKPAGAAAPDAFYGPKKLKMEAYQAIPVQLGKMEIGSGKSAKPGEVAVENTIEPGIMPERENQPAKGAQKVASSVDQIEPGVAPPAPGLGKRMLRAMGVWLQGKAEEKPVPISTAKPVLLDQPAAPVAPADEKANLVPDSVAQRFLKVERDYYFPDKTPAFSDRGNKLATRGSHLEVVRSLVEIAQARGWDSIIVKGDEDFRRKTWMEGAQAGLTVAGYKPTALDLAELANKPATNTVEKGMARERTAEPLQKPAMPVAKASAARQAQQDTAPEAATATSNPELAAKARSFEKDKPGFVMKKHPELAQAYGVVDAAKKFAEVNLPEDVRDEFVSLARRHVMQKILAGDQVKGPRIYMEPAKAKDAADQAQTQTQTPPASAQVIELAKAPRSKEVTRER